MIRQLRYFARALFTIVMLLPLTMEAAVYFQGVIYVENGKTTTVRLPDYLINEYNQHSAVPLDGGGTLRWSVSNKSLAIVGSGFFECRIMPNSNLTFPNYVTLTASFISWYGNVPQNTQAEWTVKLKEPGIEPDPSVENIDIDEKHFPDNNFRSYLLDQDYGRDRVLTTTELSTIDFIDVQNKDISDLEGIQYFYGLKKLYCNNNQLKNLVISKNKYLETLLCESNELEYLNISENTALKTLRCYDNLLTYIDVSSNTLLEELDCHNNQLTSLDVKKNLALAQLDCSNWSRYGRKCKNRITSLDVTRNTKLWKLWCSRNRLTSLNLKNNRNISNLHCDYNPLKTLDIRDLDLTYLQCDSTLISTLDVSKCLQLRELWCSQNLISTLDVSNNKKLEEINCSDNYLTDIDISNSTYLEYLWCYHNNLSSLDISKNTRLKLLHCYENKIRGTAMDDLIKNLPKREKCYLYIINFANGAEGNVCTEDHVNAARNKGWTPYYYNGTEWRSYRGSDETSVNNITLNTTSVIMHIGDTKLLEAVVGPDGAKNKSVTWLSDNTGVATVDDNGEVRAISLGTAKIYCRANDGSGVMAVCSLTVKGPDPTSISLPINVTLYVGETLRLTPTIMPEDAESAQIWKSDDEMVVMVSNDGLLFGLAEGQALVTVSTDNGLTSNVCEVKVESNPSGIKQVYTEDKSEVYSLFGQRHVAPRKGINIIRKSDGTSLKILVK